VRTVPRMVWNKKELVAEEVRTLAARYELGLLESSILLRRGVVSGESLLPYLEDDLRFAPNPFLFRDMEDVVDRLNGALDDEEAVLVFGDRDADGITSTVILVEGFQALGLKVEWRVPQGDDAYGLTVEAVQTFADAGGGLIVTVDCGISNVKEIALARELGIDVLVFDHHVAPEELPPALAFINPKIPGESYPFASLAACAVASKVVWALRFAATPLYNQRMCVLHCQPTDEGLVIEAVRLVNLTERKRLRLVFNAQSTESDLGLLVTFLQDQEIFVYDEKVQVRHLRSLFGPRADIGLVDLAPQIRQAFPSLAGKSFDELKAKSRLPRYRPETGDLDILVSLFVSSVYKAYPQLGTDFLPVLDLVALGTLADLMPLEGENRILVRLGMQTLNATRREGLRALLMRLKLLGKPLSTTDVGWSLTPVINAAGRLGRPDLAVELLLTADEARRKELAVELEDLNHRRRQMGATAWDQVLPAARTSHEALGERMTLVYDPTIARGITGILASRLMNLLGVPAVVVTLQDGRCIGSLRANRGFETRRFLDAFADLFTDYGGHDAAAGFNFPEERLAEFQARLKTLLPDFPLGSDAQSILEVDADLPLEFLKPDLLKVIDLLEPYGEGCRPLVFTCRGLTVVSLDLVGKTGAQHVRLTLDGGSHKWPAIYWNALEKLEAGEFAVGDRVDAAFQLGRNYFQGQEKPQLTILDLVRSPA
jgi:single-stranded-DNA-specific exonuclease